MITEPFPGYSRKRFRDHEALGTEPGARAGHRAARLRAGADPQTTVPARHAARALRTPRYPSHPAHLPQREEPCASAEFSERLPQPGTTTTCGAGVGWINRGGRGERSPAPARSAPSFPNGCGSRAAALIWYLRSRVGASGTCAPCRLARPRCCRRKRPRCAEASRQPQDRASLRLPRCGRRRGRHGRQA